MSDDGHATVREPRRLACIFDAFPPGTPLSLDALELAMSRDTERRCLSALDGTLARLAAPVPPTLTSLGPRGRPPEPPA